MSSAWVKYQSCHRSSSSTENHFYKRENPSAVSSLWALHSQKVSSRVKLWFHSTIVNLCNNRQPLCIVQSWTTVSHTTRQISHTTLSGLRGILAVFLTPITLAAARTESTLQMWSSRLGSRCLELSGRAEQATRNIEPTALKTPWSRIHF